MRIQVNYRTYDVEVDPSDTIWTLKWKLYSASKRGTSGRLLLPRPCHQILSFSRSSQGELNSANTIEFYGIHEGSEFQCGSSQSGAEKSFRGLLDVLRKKERTSPELVDVTQGMCVCVKHACCHTHEARVLSLHGGTMNIFYGREFLNDKALKQHSFIHSYEIDIPVDINVVVCCCDVHMQGLPILGMKEPFELQKDWRRILH